MVRNYIQSHENLVPSRHVPSLSLGFKVSPVRDWFMADMSRLCSLRLTDFLSELGAAFLPRDWDRKIRNCTPAMYQSVDEPVILWITRLRSKNTFLRNTVYRLVTKSSLCNSNPISIIIFLPYTDATQML